MAKAKKRKTPVPRKPKPKTNPNESKYFLQVVLIGVVLLALCAFYLMNRK